MWFAANVFCIVLVFKEALQERVIIILLYLTYILLGVSKSAWNDPKTSQADLAWLVIQSGFSDLPWLVNSRRGHWLGFDLAFGQATHYDYI